MTETETKVLHVNPHCGPFPGETVDIDGLTHVVIARGFLGDDIAEIWAKPVSESTGESV